MSVADTLDRALAITANLYTSHLAPRLPTPIARTLETIAAMATTLIVPVLRSGDLPSIAALLVILWLSLRTLDYIRRSVMGWVLLFVKLALLLFVVQAAWYINAYGWEKALGDAGWIGGILWGWAEGVWDGGFEHGADQNGYGGFVPGAGGRRGRGQGWNASGGRQQAWGAGAGAGRGGRNRWT